MTEHDNTAPAVWDPTARGGAGGWVRPQNTQPAAPAPQPPTQQQPAPYPPVPQPPREDPGTEIFPLAPPQQQPQQAYQQQPQPGAVGDHGPPLGARPYLPQPGPPGPQGPPTPPPPFGGPRRRRPGTGSRRPRRPTPSPASPARSSNSISSPARSRARSRSTLSSPAPSPATSSSPRNARTPSTRSSPSTSPVAGSRCWSRSAWCWSWWSASAWPGRSATVTSPRARPRPGRPPSPPAPRRLRGPEHPGRPALWHQLTLPVRQFERTAGRRPGQGAGRAAHPGRGRQGADRQRGGQGEQLPGQARDRRRRHGVRDRGDPARPTGGRPGQAELRRPARGVEAVALLKTAWQTSGDIDRAYAAWARGVGSQGCSNGSAPGGADLKRANELNPQATQAKKDFVAKWNSLANTFGLTARTWDRI
ncbi:hypothetical protein ACFQ0T_30550 [Kitasatospora gansuensis]